MRTDTEAVQRAEAAAESAEGTETLTDLLAAYKRLRSAYLYVLHGQRPEPFPEDAPVDSLDALSEHWRAKADAFRAHGADALARVCQKHAEELEAVRMWEPLDTVTLEEAVEIGGYSYSHLQHLIADGEIPNAGRKGAPRIYLRDVPRKPGHGHAPPPPSSRRALIEQVK